MQLDLYEEKMFSFTKTDQFRVYWGGGGKTIRNKKVKRSY